jgi:starvation-inducible DNA-binding protein
MPTNFAAGLNQDTRGQVIDLLNANLVNTINLTLAVKQAHWNMKGKGFIGVHEMLDDVADRLRESADTMAERAVILGGHATGTVEIVADKSTLEAYPLELSDLQEHVAHLKERFLELGAAVREAANVAESAGDVDTADLFTEVSRTVDKDAWFIGANAEAA